MQNYQVHTEVYNRIGAWGTLAGSIGLATVLWAQPPALQIVGGLGVSGLAAGSLVLGSEANRLSTGRRDRAIVGQQAAKDRSYQQLLKEQAKPVQYSLDALGSMVMSLPEVPAVSYPDPVKMAAENIKHLLIASPTRSGKTLFLQAYIWGLFEKHGAGNFDLCIVDPKCGRWLSLEQIPGIVNYVDVSEVDETLRLVAGVRSIVADRVFESQSGLKVGRKPKSYRPFYFIFDEWSDSFGFISKNDPQATKMLQADMGTIASKGAGLNVFAVIVGQTSNCNEIGFSANSRDNFSILCLGSPKGGYSAISKALDTENLIPKDDAAPLKPELKDLKQSGQYLFLTNLGANVTLGVSPDLSDFETRTIASVSPAPRSGLLGGLEDEANSVELAESQGTASKPGFSEPTLVLPSSEKVLELKPTISPQLSKVIDSFGGSEKLHTFLCAAMGTPGADGKKRTKATLLQKDLRLSGSRYSAIGKPLWQFLETEHGTIEPR